MTREEDIEHGEPLCMESFTDESTRDMHIRSRTRQERPLLHFETCSKSQREQLRNRASQKVPPEKPRTTDLQVMTPTYVLSRMRVKIM